VHALDMFVEIDVMGFAVFHLPHVKHKTVCAIYTRKERLDIALIIRIWYNL